MRAVALVALIPALAAGLAGGFGKTTSRKAAKTDAPEPAEFAALRKWCAARGASLAGVRAAKARPKLGVVDLVAEKAYKPNDVIARLPSDLALALGDPSEDELDLAACGANYYKFEYPKLYGEYVATLPEEGSLDDHPLLWSDADLAACEWPPLADEVEKRRARVAAVAAETGLTEAQVTHGCALVASRAQELRLDAGKAATEDDGLFLDEDSKVLDAPTKVLRVLLPFLDVACWAPRPNARVEVLDPDQDDSTFALTALQKIAKGDVISVPYVGSPTTPELLLNYGFVPSQRLDGSADPDGRLIARHMDHVFADASSADDRAVADDAAAPAPKRNAAKLRLTLKSVRNNKNHEALFKAVAAQAANIGPSGPSKTAADYKLPPGTARSRVAKPSSFGGGTKGG